MKVERYRSRREFGGAINRLIPKETKTFDAETIAENTKKNR
jgi:hypothetical protein